MSIEQLRSDEDPEEPRRRLAAVLAETVLASETTLWRPDYLSRELAEEIAAEIGSHAVIVPTYFTNVRSPKGSSYAIDVSLPDNVRPLRAES